MTTISDILAWEEENVPWEIERADDARRVLLAVIEDAHADRLDPQRIAVHYVRAAMSEKGKPVAAKVRRVSSRDAYVFASNLHFRIEIAFRKWARMSGTERRAALDHELCHCGYDGDGGPVILPHDLQEFRAVVMRHGLWAGDVRRMAQAMQPHLPGLDDEPSGDDELAAAGDDRPMRETCKADPDDPDSLDVTIIRPRLTPEQEAHLGGMIERAKQARAATEGELEAAAGYDETAISITDAHTGETVETTMGTMRRAACEAISEVVSR